MKPIRKIIPRVQLTNAEMVNELRKSIKKNRLLRNDLKQLHLELYIQELQSNESRSSRRDWMVFSLICVVLVTLMLSWVGFEQLGGISFVSSPQ
jgi:hypothetical protein